MLVVMLGVRAKIRPKKKIKKKVVVEVKNIEILRKEGIKKTKILRNCGYKMGAKKIGPDSKKGGGVKTAEHT